MKLFNCALALALTCSLGALANAAGTTFSGGDPGEGLDLSGNFAYAVNVDGNNPGGGQVAGDASFTAHDATPGVSITGTDLRGETGQAEFGNTANDDAVESLLTGGYWTPEASINIDVDVQENQQYVLQLLHTEGWDAVTPNNRRFIVEIEGVVVDQDFAPNELVGSQPFDRRDGTLDPTDLVAAAAVFTHNFVAGDDTLNISLQAQDPRSGDPNIYAFTLEIIPEPASVALLAAALAGGFAMRRRHR